ncbi:MAG: imidazole glycerol phosphate synthase subunit HisH [Alphaproteobacteria bacterium]|nr:imidazole glycerol phosphate synthase subunit HisH [Alphaproteobacteria bacterium]
MIAVVDSGVANLASVMAALARLDAGAEITADVGKIRSAAHVILPGVGSAEAAMKQLQAKGLIGALRGLRQPVLGICLGMQLLFTGSEEGQAEGEILPCLGVVPGTVRRLPSGPDRPIPHMGWNSINVGNKTHPLLKGIEDGSFVYFVHSYAAPVGEYTLASCEYGETFTAVAGAGNFFGCQFHPERSSRVGRAILENFLRM